MTIIELIDSDLNEAFNEYIRLGITNHKEAINKAKRDVIDSYGLTQPYDNKTLEHLNAVALAY